MLTALFQLASNALTETQVTDGPPQPPEYSSPDLLCIGFSGIEEDPVIEMNRNKAGLPNSPEREDYTIACLSSSWMGEQTDMRSVRERAYELIETFAEAIDKDHTLGGLVMRAWITSDQLIQAQTAKGAVATIRFEVNVNAFTRR